MLFLATVLTNKMVILTIYFLQCTFFIMKMCFICNTHLKQIVTMTLYFYSDMYMYVYVCMYVCMSVNALAISINQLVVSQLHVSLTICTRIIKKHFQ